MASSPASYRTTRAVVLLLLAACRSSTLYCTAIGCVDEVDATITGVPPQTLVTVVASVSGRPMQSRTCMATNGSCLIAFEEFAPTIVTFDVSWGTQHKSFTLQPNYRINQPNGAECGPTCRYAPVTLSL